MAEGSVGTKRAWLAIVLGILVLALAGTWLASRGDQAAEDGGRSAASSASADAGAARERAGLERLDDPDERGAREPKGAADNPPHAALPAIVARDGSPHGALEGRVVSWSTRRGVAGAELSFMHEGVGHTTTTGADGSYRFAAPSAGVWSLATLTADGYLPYAPDFGRNSVVFVARAGQVIRHADLLLFPAVDYMGTVVDAAGQPVVGAEVELFEAEGGERALVGIASSFRSDGEGRFEFHAPDFALLEARHPDHEPGRALVDGAAQLSHALTITMGSAPPRGEGAITGVLVDAEGIGLAGVELRAEPIGRGPPGLEHAPTALSEADGSFELAPLDDRRYVVTARPSARPRVQSEPVEPGTWLELRVDAGHILRGRLVDSKGSPVPVGTVVLLSASGPLERKRVAGLSIFDPAGEFELRELAPGSYELQAIAQGYPRSEPVAVTLPRAGEPVRVVLGEGARLWGRVVDAHGGDPLELALINVRGVDGEDSILPSHSSTVSDAEGRFELVGVTPGRVSVHAAAFAHDGRIVSGIELEPGEIHGPLTIELDSVAEGERPKTEITGIGVAIGASADAILISDVIEGGGAQAAGIVAGESIVAVDGSSVVELGFEDAVQNIRGQVGTTVELELVRLDGSRTTLEVERRVIRTP